MGRLRFLTAGESHGKGLVAIIEGMVAGLPLSEDFISHHLKRRQAGYGRSSRMKIEQDAAEIISGVRFGFTVGSPISLVIRNRVWEEWQKIMSVAPQGKRIEPLTMPRPGHADLAGAIKYGLDDIRPILERASARETAARVAVGAVARRFLEQFGVTIHSHTVSIGELQVVFDDDIDWEQVEKSPLRCANAECEKAMVAAIDRAKAEGDTLGGIFEIVAAGVPVGLGSHVHWDDRLDGRIAQAVMSIQAVKGVEIGTGFAMAATRGSQAHDIVEPGTGSPFFWRRMTNRAGGIEGGMSNGQPIVVRAAVKPVATLGKPLPSVDLRTKKTTVAHYERSDVCVVPDAGIVGEAMIAIVLADDMLEKFGGDNLRETLTNYRAYLDISGS